MSILVFLVVLSVLVFLHELGHFAVAKRAGITVHEFGLGYPPRLWRFAKRGTTEYTLNWIPFGGFVRMAGEEDPSVPGSLAGKPARVRSAVLLAGSGMNALLGLVLFFGVSLVSPYFEYAGGVTIVEVASGSPAAEAGLRPRDVIVAVDEVPIYNYEALRDELGDHLEERVSITLQREDQTLVRELVPRSDPPPQQGAIGVVLQAPLGMVVADVAPSSPAWEAGIRPGDVVLNVGGETFGSPEALRRFTEERQGWRLSVRLGRDGRDIGTVKLEVPRDLPAGQSLLGMSFRPGPLKAAQLALERAWTMIMAIPETLSGLISGRVPGDSIIGPIGIAQLTGEVVEEHGLITLLEFVGFLSLNLAVINLLPFPALDGGRLLFVGLEALRGGRRIDPRKEGVVHLVGMAVLLALMLMISYFDILRIFEGTPILR